MNSIGDRIRIARSTKKMTLEDVAKIVGVSRQTIQRYESGVIGNIPSDKIEALANALGIAPGILMGWNDQVEPSYYLNPETAQMAQEIYDNPQYRILFDATKKLKPESIKEVMKFIDYQKAKEAGDSDE